MAAPSVTYTFTNGTTADATEVNQNFTDVINGVSDGTKDITVNLFTANGAATFNGAVTLGNATGDDITVTGYVASSIIPKTNAASDLGSSSLNWQALYLDNDATDGGTIYFDADGTTFIRCNAAGTDILVDGVSSFSTDCDILPNADASYDLGSTSAGFVALYLDNGGTDGGTLYFDGSNSSYLQSDSSGADLDVQGFTGLDLKSAAIKRMSLYDEAKSANYTITDTDGVSVIHMTTSTTDRTITLPTASDNAGRVISVRKVDSASGTLTLSEEGTDQIDGKSSIVLPLQNDSAIVQCDGSTWHTLARRDVTNWTSFTPAGNMTGPSSAPSVHVATYRRVGNCMDIVLRIERAGTGSGNYSYTWANLLPSGHTFDTSVWTGTQQNPWPAVAMSAGTWCAVDESASSGVDEWGGACIAESTEVRWISGSGDIVDAAYPFTWNTNDQFTFMVLGIPISEWADAA